MIISLDLDNILYSVIILTNKIIRQVAIETSWIIKLTSLLETISDIHKKNTPAMGKYIQNGLDFSTHSDQ